MRGSSPEGKPSKLTNLYFLNSWFLTCNSWKKAKRWPPWNATFQETLQMSGIVNLDFNIFRDINALQFHVCVYFCLCDENSTWLWTNEGYQDSIRVFVVIKCWMTFIKYKSYRSASEKEQRKKFKGVAFQSAHFTLNRWGVSVPAVLWPNFWREFTAELQYA